MNLVDIAIVVFALVYGYRGYRIGIVRSIFSFVSILLSLYIAFIFCEDLSVHIRVVVSNEYLSILLSFVFIFIVVNYLVNRLGVLFEGLVDKLYLGWANSFLGGIFNFVKGALLVGFILFVVSGFSYNSSFSSVLNDSKISPILLSSFNRLVVFINESLPDDLRKRWDEYSEALDKLLD